MATIKMRKAAMTLHYRESKPTVYKLRQLTYAPIKAKDVTKYIANSANIPTSTVEACVAAIAEGIVYYAINGMRVSFPELGGFYVGVKTKVAQSIEDLNVEDTLKACRLMFAPATELREALAEAGTTIVDSGAYTLPEPEEP